MVHQSFECVQHVVIAVIVHNTDVKDIVAQVARQTQRHDIIFDYLAPGCAGMFL
jgi:hypothetical protein